MGNEGEAQDNNVPIIKQPAFDKNMEDKTEGENN